MNTNKNVIDECVIKRICFTQMSRQKIMKEGVTTQIRFSKWDWIPSIIKTWSV